MNDNENCLAYFRVHVYGIHILYNSEYTASIALGPKSHRLSIYSIIYWM